MDLKIRAPWWLKLFLKLMLSKLPLPYGFWRQIGIFRHGYMDDPKKAIETFAKYYQSALAHGGLPKNFSSLELGPGDSILSGLVARAHTSGSVWLVDSGKFADTDICACREAADLLKMNGLVLPAIEEAKSIGDLLEQFSINYLTSGVTSLKEIPTESVDFVWSQVVLEHVSAKEFPELLRQLKRILKPEGIGIHSIDFRDHLTGGLNNLRFPNIFWESNFFCNAGFYTNRLRPKQMLEMFESAGFTTKILSETRWPVMPIKRHQMAEEFSGFIDEDFMVAELEIAIRPR